MGSQATCRAHCSGHGRCEAKHCLCDAGFAGSACSRAVPNACINNCGGHGSCLADGVCACDVGFSGRDCSQPDPPPCPLGCSGRGLCGPSGECICEPDLIGPACTIVGGVNGTQTAATTRHPVAPLVESASRPAAAASRPKGASRLPSRIGPAHTPCPGNCSGHGTCSRAACVCHPGFGGAACAAILPVCTSNCSGHGSCDAARQTCDCHPGYAGDKCEIAMPVGCPMGCSAHGTCATGAYPALPDGGEGGCSCRDGLAPPACAYATGTRQARVAAAVAAVLGMLPGRGGARCPLGCSGRGRCLGESCVCAAGFSGAGCERATPRCPADCNSHGACIDGFCACERGWQGVECATPAYECPGGCGGHGTCIGVGVSHRRLTAPAAASGHEGVCSCAAGYTGATCDRFALTAEHCLHNCSGRGACLVSGECACAPGYAGAACELIDRAHGECPNGCCGHGVCTLHGGNAARHLSSATARALGFNGGRASRHCECDALWSGADCCTPARSDSCPHGCSGHGLCVDGACVCEHGWHGGSCALMDVLACLRACSAHGTCRKDGTCHCERGFTGVACELGDPFGASSTNGIQAYADARS